MNCLSIKPAANDTFFLLNCLLTGLQISMTDQVLFIFSGFVFALCENQSGCSRPDSKIIRLVIQPVIQQAKKHRVL